MVVVRFFYEVVDLDPVAVSRPALLRVFRLITQFGEVFPVCCFGCSISTCW